MGAVIFFPTSLQYFPSRDNNLDRIKLEMLIMTSALSKSDVCGLAIVFLLVWYASRLVYNVYFHPLAKFPGPRLAGASRWYEAYFDNLVGCGGQYMNEIDRIHRDYGDLHLPYLQDG